MFKKTKLPKEPSILFGIIFPDDISQQLWLPNDVNNTLTKPIAGFSDKNRQHSYLTGLILPGNQPTVSKVFSRQDIPNETTVKSCLKIRIYPDFEQKQLFNKCFGVTRYLYNKTVAYLNNAYDEERQNKENLAQNGCIHFVKHKKKNGKIKNKQCMKPIDPNNKFCCRKHFKQGKKSNVKLVLGVIRPEIMKSDDELGEDEQWLKEIPYDTRQLAIKEAIGAFKSNLALKRDGYIDNFDIKFKKRNAIKHNFHLNKTAMNFNKKNLRLFARRLQKPIRIRNRYKKYLKKKFNKKKIGDSVIIKQTPDIYYLCIPYKRKVKNKKAPFNNVALDPGIRTFQTYYSSEGICGKLGKDTWKQIRDIGIKVDNLTSLQQKTKNKNDWNAYRNQKMVGNRLDNNRKRTRRNLRMKCFQLRNKMKNIVKDLHWKTANFLCRNFQNILFPKLETQKLAMKARRRAGGLTSKTVRNMMSLSHYEFSQKLLYKASCYKRTVIRANEAWTSKTCSKCGHIKNNLGTNKIYNCDNCGMEMDRDVNGARNILIRLLTVIMEMG